MTPAAAATAVESLLAGDGRERAGIEIEWPVYDGDDPSGRPHVDDLRAVCEVPLPAGGRATVEPGGQLELSTAPAGSIEAALDAAAGDATVLRSRLAHAGLTYRESALDSSRIPSRILPHGRYAAMESFFDAGGDAGRWMMCNTASLQVNLSNHPTRPERRWELANRLGPILVATFANSPGRDASGHRWESLRQGIWGSIDPARTVAVSCSGSMAESWLRYALAADVMLLRTQDGRDVAVPPGLSFGSWMAHGHELGWPTVEDLLYHLTTLFPPVRPRGWLELRMIDALPWSLLEVGALVTTTALTVDDAMDELLARLEVADSLWLDAARYGLAHPLVAECSRTLFEVIRPHLAAVARSRTRHDGVLAFEDRFVRRAMSPAQLVGCQDLPYRPCPALAVSEPLLAAGNPA
ncbi:glutamate-cysteine ligase family protein [Pseudonocardia endophytica]|uniref:Glutamate--cysteine ligase EgtA n=1 Tax=Pseudonocardia endophytica TaxID=401976 RepID=A0A4V2PIW7_PSEEN|nr:glutamate-cysteine ligase family protein [Pseudonocardia endophytica]TCK26266.1 glutamate--cysteine ligase [Pseudonocardia endophytica]